MPTTTLAAQTANNTSAANGFLKQANGNAGAGNVSKVDVHSLLYPGASTKIYAHLMLWFGGSNHMNVGYSSTDAAQVHQQITDMMAVGSMASPRLVRPEQQHRSSGKAGDGRIRNSSWFHLRSHHGRPRCDQIGFLFRLLAATGPDPANCNTSSKPTFPHPAYMTQQGRPVVTNFNIDLAYTVDWTAVNAALATEPVFLFQNNDGFGHVLSDGSFRG